MRFDSRFTQINSNLFKYENYNTQGMKKDWVENIATEIVDSVFQVHRTLGPGLLEEVYEKCLAYELRLRGLKVNLQKPLPIVYGDVKLECGYRLDMVVEDAILLELKSVDRIVPIHMAQTITYLKLSGIELGFLINFNVKLIKNGITRVVNNF